MGVQITVSGKLRGDRSAFEKHTAGVLPRAGHHAEVIVDEDVAHVNTPMGLIGVRIRIAHKERRPPEFEMRSAEDLAKAKKIAREEAGVDDDDNDKDDGSGDGGNAADGGAKDADAPSDGSPATESEHIKIEGERIKELDTMEEEEAAMR